jgi:ABC-type metal ion transport system substrate-binding protein
VATDINDRVDKLEAIAENTAERLLALERDVAIIKTNYATKADLAELKSELKFDLAEVKAELKAEIKVAVSEAKTITIMWVVSAIFLAQLLPALSKNFGVLPH